MSSVKELKSVDLTSYTIIMTGIAVLFSILSSILLTIGLGIINPNAIAIGIYLIPTIVVFTLMYTIYNSFCEGFLYNILASRLNKIKLHFDGETLVKISTAETAIITSIIITIQAILVYLASMMVVPLLIDTIIQTMMMTGQQALAYSLYQLLIIINQPVTVLLFIFGTFVLSFIVVLIGTSIYNVLGSKGKGITFELSEKNEFTVIESVDYLKFTIVFAIIFGIINLIIAIISLIATGNAVGAIINIIGGFVGGFIEGALFAVFYNFLAKKLEKLKIELIDQ